MVVLTDEILSMPSYPLVILIIEGTCFETVIHILIAHSIGQSMGIVGCVMLHYSCWSHIVELTFDLTSRTQVFNTGKSEHMRSTEQVVWIWGSLPKLSRPLRWISMVIHTDSDCPGICTMWDLHQFSVLLLYYCFLAWILGWRGGFILFLCVTIASIEGDILTCVLLSSFPGMVALLEWQVHHLSSSDRREMIIRTLARNRQINQ